MAAKITYQGTGQPAAYAFHTAGRPQFSRTARYEPDVQGGVPRRALVTYTITEWFQEPGFADNQARLSALIAALRTTEGRLVITDENDTILVNVTARPEQHTLPEQWGQYFTETSVSFVAREELAVTSPASATFRAGGTGTPIALQSPYQWKETVRTDRYATAVSNRRETVVSIVASGRIHADPNATESDRRRGLEAQKAAIQACSDCAEGLLAFGDFSRTVRVENFDAEIRDADSLDWTLSAFYRRFPDGDYAEADFSFDQKEDADRHEIVTAVKGRVRAAAEETARGKAASIRDSFEPSGGALRISETSAQELSGTDGDAFIEMTFNYEWRGTSSDTEPSYTLTVSDKADLRAGQIITTYAGTVTAADSATALARARQIGDNKYPFRMTATETINTSVTSGGDPQFREVQFSYEYTRKGTWQYAEVTADTGAETFGTSSQTVSGFAVAADAASALTLAHSFRLTSRLQRSSRESQIDYHKGADGLFVKVDFSYSYHLGPAQGAISYRKKTAVDYGSRETVTTYSGTAWGADESAADALISALVTGLAGRNVADERESAFDNSMSIAAFISRSFTITRAVALAASGDDILEAEYSLDLVGSIDHAVLTPIPQGTAHVQTACGTTIGTKTASGTCVALTEATARTWGRGKRTLAASGGYEQAPQEKTGTMYYPMSGASIKAYRFDFTYSAQFVNLAL